MTSQNQNLDSKENNQPQNSSDCFISKAEVATRLGKTARTIEHWMQRGVIPYLKLAEADAPLCCSNGRTLRRI